MFKLDAGISKDADGCHVAGSHQATAVLGMFDSRLARVGAPDDEFSPHGIDHLSASQTYGSNFFLRFISNIKFNSIVFYFLMIMF